MISATVVSRCFGIPILKSGNVTNVTVLTGVSMKISSYSQVYNLGHRAIEQLFDGIVVAQEKVDGSQFSFGLIDGELYCRSKGKRQMPEQPDKMFAAGVEYLKSLTDRLPEGVVFRAEYLQKPKHNVLAYSRIPRNHFALFDVDANGQQNYEAPSVLEFWAASLDIEAVPWFTAPYSIEAIKTELERESFLGGTTVEGIVFKNYARFDVDKKTLMGKYVSEAFKEQAHSVWGKPLNPRQELISGIVERFGTKARWHKAIQHIRENGELSSSPSDIGNLIREVHQDLRLECADEIKDMLFAHFWKTIAGGVVKGLPEWYKQQLLDAQFEPKD
jgi:hypothetical protein